MFYLKQDVVLLRDLTFSNSDYVTGEGELNADGRWERFAGANVRIIA